MKYKLIRYDAPLSGTGHAITSWLAHSQGIPELGTESKRVLEDILMNEQPQQRVIDWFAATPKEIPVSLGSLATQDLLRLQMEIGQKADALEKL